MTVVAEELLKGDGIIIFVKNKRVDRGESLELRMNRVQQFILDIFDMQIVEEITLHINSCFREETMIQLKASDFITKILEIYKQEKNWTPTIKLIISRG
jgi:hypothetical protein